ncbi:MAG: SCO family protein [Terriglobales bacterium]|jgi:protein SCO1/2
MKRLAIFVVWLLASAGCSWADQRYPATGMLLKVEPSHGSFVVSCQNIPGYMDAMVMPFRVREGKELEGLVPGVTVDFTLVVEKESSYAEHLKVRPYESVEQDPLTARRLRLLNELSHPSSNSTKALSIGQTVPNFTLNDQNRHKVALSRFRGKVVVVNFIYTSCALPNFCFRNSNTFGVLQKRFKERMGRDLVLLTVSFDPQRDQPDVLARYAKTWKANPATWHFLTGPVPDVQRVSNMFGMDYFPDEGLMDHSLHTAIINRQGRLAANIEGNQFTADQLGDLVKTLLESSTRASGTITAQLDR